MDQNFGADAIPVDVSSLEEGDLLLEAGQFAHHPDVLTDVESALCDGEGGMAPSKGTKA